MILHMIRPIIIRIDKIYFIIASIFCRIYLSGCVHISLILYNTILQRIIIKLSLLIAFLLKVIYWRNASTIPIKTTFVQLSHQNHFAQGEILSRASLRPFYFRRYLLRFTSAHVYFDPIFIHSASLLSILVVSIKNGTNSAHSIRNGTRLF